MERQYHKVVKKLSEQQLAVRIMLFCILIRRTSYNDDINHTRLHPTIAMFLHATYKATKNTDQQAVYTISDIRPPGGTLSFSVHVKPNISSIFG